MDTSPWTPRFRLTRYVILDDWNGFRSEVEKNAADLTEVTFGPIVPATVVSRHAPELTLIGGHHMKILKKS